MSQDNKLSLLLEGLLGLERQPTKYDGQFSGKLNASRSMTWSVERVVENPIQKVVNMSNIANSASPEDG
jgi:hypothetical protein